MLGLYSVKIFGCEIIVYIMTNLSPKNVAISEKFDIKGSYVKRNAIPPRGMMIINDHIIITIIINIIHSY